MGWWSGACCHTRCPDFHNRTQTGCGRQGTGTARQRSPLLREVEKLWHNRLQNNTASAGFGAGRCRYTVNPKRNATGVIACGPVYAGADNSEQWDIYRFSTLRDTHAGTLVIGDVLYSTRSPTRPPGDLVLPN